MTDSELFESYLNGNIGEVKKAVLAKRKLPLLRLLSYLEAEAANTSEARRLIRMVYNWHGV